MALEPRGQPALEAPRTRQNLVHEAPQAKRGGTQNCRPSGDLHQQQHQRHRERTRTDREEAEREDEEGQAGRVQAGQDHVVLQVADEGDGDLRQERPERQENSA